MPGGVIDAEITKSDKGGKATGGDFNGRDAQRTISGNVVKNKQSALSTKLNLVITAQAVPEFNELRGAYTGPGLNYNYFPTLMEWLLAVWIVGVVALVALAGYRLVIRRLAPTTVTQS